MKSTTLLLRQVHPAFLSEGRVSSQAFTPFPKDKNLLSVYNGDLIAPDKSYEHYVQKYQSVGVWAVTQSETTDAGLSARSDPLENFDEHAVVDFAELSPREARKKAKILVGMASQRGCLYKPEQSD